MKKILAFGIMSVVLMTVLMSAASAHPFCAAPTHPVEVNETNFEEVKMRMLSKIDERIALLENLRSEIEKVESPEELKNLLEEQALEMQKDRILRKIEMTIKWVEKNSEESGNIISELETLKEDVNAVSSIEELKEVQKEFRE
ncbi:MAG: hypothetical protein H5T46_04640, partial [Archaeoglobi archaeon]|nr:hypothetical protein [Candidatus Mnemosynella sp.]